MALAVLGGLQGIGIGWTEGASNDPNFSRYILLINFFYLPLHLKNINIYIHTQTPFYNIYIDIYIQSPFYFFRTQSDDELQYNGKIDILCLLDVINFNSNI